MMFCPRPQAPGPLVPALDDVRRQNALTTTGHDHACPAGAHPRAFLALCLTWPVSCGNDSSTRLPHRAIALRRMPVDPFTAVTVWSSTVTALEPIGEAMWIIASTSFTAPSKAPS